MKSVLNDKYGNQTETVGKFDSPYYEGSGLELYALREDKCTFMTHFVSKSGNGFLRLKIASDASLVINYIDTVNFLLMSGKAKED